MQQNLHGEDIWTPTKEFNVCAKYVCGIGSSLRHQNRFTIDSVLRGNFYFSIFGTIVRRKLLLLNGILKKIFRMNLKLGVQLLIDYIADYEKYLMNTEEFMKQ